ncbi:MAG: DUF3014 domain-containing protein [Elusimicrobia bacterium]|nr:DUF3014 domain-containing protein [Elusimicrobiota bacterium]
MENGIREKIFGVLFAACVAGGIYVFRSRPPAPAPGLSSPPPAAAPAEPPPNLPRLEESDSFVRQRAGALSTSSLLAEWLKLDELIARMSTAMGLIAQGKVPRDSFTTLGPRGKFPVKTVGGKLYVDPRGYARYDAFAGLVRSLNAAATAKVLLELAPLFEQAQGLRRFHP